MRNPKPQKGSSGKKQYEEEDEEDGDLQDFGYNQNADEDEVSLDIQDAIATAEEINLS